MTSVLTRLLFLLVVLLLPVSMLTAYAADSSVLPANAVAGQAQGKDDADDCDKADNSDDANKDAGKADQDNDSDGDDGQSTCEYDGQDLV